VPLYEYKCVKCGKKTEKIETVAGPHLKKCPHCGGKVEQAITAPSIQFKGSGWYVTDYAGKSPAKDGAGAEKPLYGRPQGVAALPGWRPRAHLTGMELSCRRAEKKATIQAGSGIIWRIPGKEGERT
jgi:putative FmdB family regulatory protein